VPLTPEEVAASYAKAEEEGDCELGDAEFGDPGDDDFDAGDGDDDTSGYGDDDDDEVGCRSGAND
jgi:hypothetical protein